MIDLNPLKANPMHLTAYPFDAATGELLPVYRDAYLRGDLSPTHARLVDAHLKNNPTLGTQTWQRFHTMQQTGEVVQSVGWMQRQLELVRTSPQRVRRQAAAVATLAALIGGAVFAAPTPLAPSAPRLVPTAEAPAEAPAEAASIMAMTTVRGRILDENGRPLVGATVLEKGTQRGVSTNANGEYMLRVPMGRPTTLAYGYGGYTDDEVPFTGRAGSTVENLTLVPTAPTHRAKRWFFFR